MNSDKVLVFTATYNEADNIGPLIDRILHYVPHADVLVVDDNSPDGTGARLDAIQRANPRVQVIHRYRKLGLGTAHKIAIHYAIMNGYDKLVTMDADFSHNPKYLPRMLRELDDNEFVIGSRYAPGGKSDYGLKRIILSRTANILTKFLLGIKLHETTTSFRGYTRTLFEKMDIDEIQSDGYSFFVDCIYHITTVTDSTKEFPIHFHDRREGISKISKVEVYKGVLNIFRLFFKKILRLKRRENVFHNHHELLYVTCNVCNLPYCVEIYPSTSSKSKSDMYICTSTHHASHGRIVKCLTCGLLYTNPQLPEDKICHMYSMAVDEAYINNIDSRIRTFDYNFNRIKRWLPDKGTLLDVGSYCGVFLKVANEKGYDVRGLEPSGWAARFAREHFNLEVINGTLSDIQSRADRYDIITAWDVLEHFTDPMGELRLIHEKLNPGGKFVFSTLNIANRFPSLLGERWPWLMDMHLYYFNESLIGEMLRLADFKLLRVKKYCHIITLSYLIYKLEHLGIWGMRYLRKIVTHTPLGRIYVPFRLGDIQLFIGEKR
jgi:glycosyltransferase involved in cell wall biosynthesis/2-polyprenyl-3-methyl-5-hydroxy-6-metoxy-1,4-benzoquinol methylase